MYNNMKKIFILSFLLASCTTLIHAQILGLGKKLSEYKATNGKTYQVGDTIKLGQGSAPNGTFRYLQYGGWETFFISSDGTDSHNVERQFSGYGAIIKKMHSFK